jgi:2-haloacid dehalogenase
MTIAAQLRPKVRAFVFDAYGTLFDVHAAVNRHAGALNIADPARFSAHWRAKQLEYTWIHALSGRFVDFWTLTQRALDHAFATFPDADPSVREKLLDAYRVLDAYPEAANVLKQLKSQGFSTGILSNGETGMLADAVRSAGLAGLLDQVISVDEVAVFKTDPRTYALVESRFSLTAGEVAFVSSNRWDVAGAAAFGFTCLWVNRAGLPDEYPGLMPAATLRDLSTII